MRTVGLLLAGALALCASGALAQNPDDHPLVTSYPGSVLEDKAREDFAAYRVVTGLAGQDFVSQEVAGTLTRLRYSSPADRSEAEIFANYVQALEASGYRELWRCIDEECGPAFAAARWNRFNGTINLGNDAHYVAGSLATAGGEAYVVVAVAPRQHQITIVEVSAMEEGLVSVDPDALGDELDVYGHVAIPGVFFATGKAELTAESAAALAAMAQILGERPELSVWVVGHTDWTGGFDLNMSLSDARADAVVKALTDDYGIDARRLDGYGVGPLSPDASNGTDTGRTANRRVELVARPVE
jgi:outer membrane protein OmpA-like peptidoglycan-associated protein